MHTARRHPRISDTRDVLAHLGSLGRSPQAGRVLNYSEGGMLLAGGDLKVGERTSFDLAGPSFHYAGVAEVAHLTNGATGLRFLSWQDHAGRPTRSLANQRSDWAVPAPVPQRDRPVMRRVAVLVGPERAPGRDASSGLTP